MICRSVSIFGLLENEALKSVTITVHNFDSVKKQKQKKNKGLWSQTT